MKMGGGVMVDLEGSRDRGGAAHLHPGHRRWVWGDLAALAGRGSVRRRPPGRGSGSAASVAEARHHLSGSLREDELLTQFHVGPAFS